MTLARRVSTIGGVAALVLVTACGGGTDGASDEAATPETVAPTTTVAETTTTTTTIPPILAPLTGLPVDAPLTRPALVAKIDNLGSCEALLRRFAAVCDKVGWRSVVTAINLRWVENAS